MFDLRCQEHKPLAMDVHDLVKEVNRRGITMDTKAVVWASTCNDLSYLKKWFAVEGYGNVLPPNENCLPLVHPFRQQLDMFTQGKHF